MGCRHGQLCRLFVGGVGFPALALVRVEKDETIDQDYLRNIYISWRLRPFGDQDIKRSGLRQDAHERMAISWATKLPGKLFRQTSKLQLIHSFENGPRMAGWSGSDPHISGLRIASECKAPRMEDTFTASMISLCPSTKVAGCGQSWITSLMLSPRHARCGSWLR